MDAPQLQGWKVRVQRVLSGLVLVLAACSSLPDTHFEKYEFPQGVYVGDVKNRPYTVLGLVKTRVDYKTLDANHEESDLCRNYFNKGSRDLLKLGKKQGADAVLDVKSVVFYEDGTSKTYPDPECTDEGEDGQILLQGIAVRWKSNSLKDEFQTGFVPARAMAPPVPTSLPSEAPAALAPPSNAKFRSLKLELARDGLDGGIRIVEQPTRVVLFTLDKQILDEQPIDAKKLWFTQENFALGKDAGSDRTILLHRTAGNQDLSQFFNLKRGKLEPEFATDTSSGIAQILILHRGPSADWQITDGQPRDVLEVNSADGKVNYARFHWVGSMKGWSRSVRAEAGTWKTGSPFPSPEKFPPTNTN